MSQALCYVEGAGLLYTKLSPLTYLQHPPLNAATTVLTDERCPAAVCVLCGVFAGQSHSQQATRHARRVYVGGLPPTANEGSVSTFFSHALAAVGGNTAGPGASRGRRGAWCMQDFGNNCAGCPGS